MFSLMIGDDSLFSKNYEKHFNVKCRKSDANEGNYLIIDLVYKRLCPIFSYCLYELYYILSDHFN